jgi:hypothetical protein
MLNWGAFWVVNMLFVERLHVLLKKMGAGHKDRMQSFVNHYDLWDAAQSEWRWRGEWATKPKKSTMAGYREVPEYDTKTVAKGARHTLVLRKDLHNCNCSRSSRSRTTGLMACWTSTKLTHGMPEQRRVPGAATAATRLYLNWRTGNPREHL